MIGGAGPPRAPRAACGLSDCERRQTWRIQIGGFPPESRLDDLLGGELRGHARAVVSSTGIGKAQLGRNCLPEPSGCSPGIVAI